MAGSSSRIPYSAPGGTAASVIALLTVGIVTIVAATVLFEGSPGAAWAFCIGAAIFVPGSWFAGRASTVGRSLGRSVAAGCVAMMVSVALNRLPLPVLLESLFGAGIMGALLGLVCAPAPASVAHARAARSLDAFHAVLATCGLWLSIAGAVFTAPMFASKGSGLVRHVFNGHASIGQVLALCVLLAGVALSVFAVVRHGVQLRWIARVYAARVPGWRIARAEEHPVDASRPSLLDTVKARDAVLVCDRAEGGESFRTLAGVEAMAAVDLDPAPMLSVARQHVSRLVLAVLAVWGPAIVLAVGVSLTR